MLAISTSWNAEARGGWAAAVAALVGAGHRHVALDGPVLYPDAAQARRVVEGAKGRVVALFAPAPRIDPGAPPGAVGIAAPRDDARARGFGAALAAARRAAEAGTGTVVLRAGGIGAPAGAPSLDWDSRLRTEGATQALREEVRSDLHAAGAARDRWVEALCRSLHDLCRALPDVSWSVETPRSPRDFPLAGEMELVLDDLPRRKVGYWHHAGHAARLDSLGAVRASEWLERTGHATSGVTISDWSPTGGDGLPPGAGIVDWAGLVSQLSARMLRVIAIDGAFPSPLLDDALREARGLGLGR